MENQCSWCHVFKNQRKSIILGEHLDSQNVRAKRNWKNISFNCQCFGDRTCDRERLSDACKAPQLGSSRTRIRPRLPAFQLSLSPAPQASSKGLHQILLECAPWIQAHFLNQSASLHWACVCMFTHTHTHTCVSACVFVTKTLWITLLHLK